MTRTLLRALLLLSFALLSTTAHAAEVPKVLGYTGRLLKADGSPATGTVTMRFDVFDAETGGSSPLYTESHMVGLSDGQYALFIGSVTPIPDTLFDGRDLYLEVTVDGDTLSPRQRIASVAYALKARDAVNAVNATNVSGGTVNATSIQVNGTTVIDSKGQLAAGAGGAFVTGVDVDAPLTSSGGQKPKLGIKGCVAGEILKWDGTAWVCSAISSASGTVSSVDSGAGLTGGPITSSGTLSIANGGVTNGMLANPSVTVTAGSGLSGGGTVPLGGSTSLSIPNGGVTNTMLASPSVNVTAGAGLSGGGSVPLGGTTTLSIANGGVTSGMIANGAISFSDMGLNACTANQVMKVNAAGTAWICSPDASNAGTVTSVASGAGLTGGPITGSGTLSIATGGVTSGMISDGTITFADMGLNACTANQVMKMNAAGTAWTCAPDASNAGTVTSVASGAGLTGGPITGSGTLSIANAGVTNAMLANPSVTVAAGAGLSGGGSVALGGTTTLSIPNNGVTSAMISDGTIAFGDLGVNACTANQVIKMNAAGTGWACGTDTSNAGTVTSVASGAGLTGGPITSSGTLSIANAGVTNAMLANSSVTVTAGAGLSGGGNVALGGTTSLSIPNNGVTSAMISDGTIAFADVGLNACTANQVMKVNAAGTGWACGTDTSNAGTVTSVASGPGLTGGPITSSGQLSIANAGVTNAMLANSSVTVTAGAGLSGGGNVALGGTTSLSIPNNGVTSAMISDGTIAFADVGLNACTANQVMKVNAAGTGWACGTDTSNAGTVTSVASGAGLTGGPITGSGTLSIATGGVTNTMLANPSVTVTAGAGLAGGGSVALGGSTTLTANVQHDATLTGDGAATPLGVVNGVPSGTILPFIGNTAPAGFAIANGQAVSRTTAAGLFAVIGTAYGAGDGSTTFNVPDLRGRVAVGFGGGGETATLGNTDGLSTVTARKIKHNHGKGTLSASGGSHAHGASGTGYVSLAGYPCGTDGSVAEMGDLCNQPRSSQSISVTVNSATHSHPNSEFSGVVGDTAGPTDSPAFMVLNYIIKL